MRKDGQVFCFWSIFCSEGVQRIVERVDSIVCLKQGVLVAKMRCKKGRLKFQWCLISSVCVAVEQTVPLLDDCMIDCSLLSLRSALSMLQNCYYYHFHISVTIVIFEGIVFCTFLFWLYLRFAVASGYCKKCSILRSVQKLCTATSI